MCQVRQKDDNSYDKLDQTNYTEYREREIEGEKEIEREKEINKGQEKQREDGTKQRKRAGENDRKMYGDSYYIGHSCCCPGV